jgi:hypothetical protein
MTNDVTNDNAAARELELRDRAVKQLKKRRDFRGHLLIYLLVNTFLVVVWAVTSGADEFFWPVFPIVGWGIGVIANWYDAYHGDDFSEDSIQHEMDRLSHLH